MSGIQTNGKLSRTKRPLNGNVFEKDETGAVGRALAMCGYGTLQAPEFDEGDRLADAPLANAKTGH
jgi:hypothetical protein